MEKKSYSNTQSFTQSSKETFGLKPTINIFYKISADVKYISANQQDTLN